MPLVSFASPAASAADDKGGVKAAIIFNILRFASFPDSDPTLTLCTRAGEAIAPNLRTLDGRSIGPRRLNVVFVPSLDDATRGCDVIYAGYSSAGAIRGAARGQITIGEDPAFVDRNGTIGLINFGGQVRFAINLKAARSANVQIGSQLMRLAARVIN